MRTIKEDLIWIKKWKLPSQFEGDLKAWIVKYNTDFPRFLLKCKTPEQFEKELLSRTTKFAA